MKKVSILLLMAALASTMALAGNENFGASNVSTSDCKERRHAPSRSTVSDDGEWLEYAVEKRDDGLYLHVKHVNTYFNCATWGAECSAKMEGNVITIDERELGDEGADCICPYDVTYDVGPLQEGTYTVVLTMYGYKLAEFSVYVTDSYRNRFNIGAYAAKIEAELPAIPEDKAIYDLLGRRYNSFPFPGIFIQNGKKIVWKGK